jgi:hypothetical protein
VEPTGAYVIFSSRRNKECTGTEISWTWKLNPVTETNQDDWDGGTRYLEDVSSHCASGRDHNDVVARRP